MTQAYSQSKYELNRRIYIQPKREDLELFDLGQDEVFELIKPLYGICEACDFWGISMEEHLVNDLKMLPTPGDSALYVKSDGKKVIGLTVPYVDDSLNGGTEEFIDLTNATLAKFESKVRVYDSFDFYGTQINSDEDGALQVSQRYYINPDINNLDYIDNGADFEEYRRHRALFSWLANTRHDNVCVENKAAQVTLQTFSTARKKELNVAIKKVNLTADLGLQYGKMHTQSAHLRIYTDASFASNDDLSSQVGVLVLLCDENDKSPILDYKSKKSKRIVRSIMAGEVCAFMDGFDLGFAIAADLEMTLHRKLSMFMYTDSKQLFDAMTEGKHTAERRLMVDILAARQSYRRFEIEGVAVVPGDVSPADALSKAKGNDALDRLMATSVDETPVEQWIERDNLPQSSAK